MAEGPSTGAPMPTNMYGDELLQHLRRGWKPLPPRTLLAMAMGGLRVRMMRSAVTMLSIVLAIAFLTYTGLTNQLTFRLASSLEAMEAFDPVSPDRLRTAVHGLRDVDFLAGMSRDQKRQLAMNLGMAEVTELELSLPEREGAYRNATTERDRLAAQRTRLEGSATALPADLTDIRARAAEAERRAAALGKELEESKAIVAVGRHLRARQVDAALDQQVDEHLARRIAELRENLRRPTRLSDYDLVITGELVAHASDRIDPVTLGVIETMLDQERRKRDAGEIKSLMRSAGVNIEATLAGNPMDTWLITMAMLTCAVGIANAMLMSVTERFREIGTMKCLGAQDNLVVKLFLLESGVLGVVGGAIGIVLGIGVAMLGAVLQFRLFGLTAFPWLAGINVIILSVLGGLILSVVGAVYPAFAASRMKPVDALRVDE